MSPDQLIAENIFVSVGTKEILKGSTISVARGHITGLLGRNGAGKSTMLQAIFGTRHASDCNVFINGIRISAPYTHDGLLVYLPQRSFLPPSLTVARVMKEYRTDTALAFSHFPELKAEADKKIAELSGGMERLVSVIVLLLSDARFILLDEPFSHIMPLHIERLQQLMQLQKEKKGIIITDHLYRPLLAVSDNIYLMKEGHTVYITNRDDLVMHGYLSELP